MGQFAIGQPVPRTEDPRLLKGLGRYVDDVNLRGQAHAYVVRSPHAHARIVSIDSRAASAAPGVVLVLTGEDYARDGLGFLPVEVQRKRKDGAPMVQPPHPALVKDRVRLVGDYVALIVAETYAEAKDAAELLEVGYEPLPAVVSTAEAIKPGAPRVWDDCPDNVSWYAELGNRAAADAAFASAAHVTRAHLVIPRITANTMEPRGAIGDYDPHEERMILHVGPQNPHQQRQQLAEIFKVPETRIRVVATDVGGSFGMKGGCYHENVLVVWAARKLGRPVKWVSERSEGLMSDDQARDNITDAELALDKDGKFLALRVRTIAAMGAYLAIRGPMPPVNNLGTLAGVYTTPAIHVEVTAVFTNTNSTAPYRGAGRPEAAYVIERLIDKAAAEMGFDRVALRRRNTIPPSAMPFKTGLVFTYDCGEFEKNMDMALEMADYAGYPARAAATRTRGRLRGLGITNTIEQAASPNIESAAVRFDPSGTVTLLIGSVSHGQGHDTTFKQILSERLGLDTDLIRLVAGDTDKITYSRGTFGSRSATTAGTALVIAADKVIAKAKKIAAHVLEASEGDIVFAGGRLTIAGTDRGIGLIEVAKIAYNPAKLPAEIEPGLDETGQFLPKVPNFPNGCHVCEVEVDPETGQITVERYAVVDDVGTVINPLLLKGQVHGGIAQGLGQALMEYVHWDHGSGQLVTGSFMDYAMPRADDLCAIEVKANAVPTKTNSLGVKGAGEAGTVGALPAVMNAVIDALAPLGVGHIDMPLTPERVWSAIRANERRRA
ncbi:MAG: xanthine dehydrogenase family protein molybdopterin-binding subunit [Alphaproteobacteria bacterium]|nr:xanthine dehydrogenase family protein molybdopterin-binding subunit [Alphaproteobacteria bacterium]